MASTNTHTQNNTKTRRTPRHNRLQKTLFFVFLGRIKFANNFITSFVINYLLRQYPQYNVTQLLNWSSYNVIRSRPGIDRRLVVKYLELISFYVATLLHIYQTTSVEMIDRSIYWPSNWIWIDLFTNIVTCSFVTNYIVLKL